MKIKIDDKKVLYLVTLLFTKDGNNNKIEMNQSFQKEAKDDFEAINLSILALQTKHNKVNVMVQAAMGLTPAIFKDDEKIETKKTGKVINLNAK